MADPYDYSDPGKDEPPKFTIMTLIAVVFVAFMVWQIGTTIADGPDILAANSVQEGDTIEYDYVARLPDGRLYETTMLEVARSANQTGEFPLEAPLQYMPARAKIGAGGLGWGQEADQEVVGARVGRTVTFTVDAANATGTWQPFTPEGPGVPRTLFTQPFQRTIFLQEVEAAAAEGNQGSPDFNITSLDDQIGPLEDDMVFNPDRSFPPSWDIVFEDVNFDNKSILIRHTVQDGDTYTDTGLPGEVVAVIEDGADGRTLSWRLDLVEGATFTVQPQSGLFNAGFSPGSYLVDDVSETHIRFLHHRAMDPGAIGQPLEIELTVRQIVERGTAEDVAQGGGASAGPRPGGDDGHAGHDHSH